MALSAVPQLYAQEKKASSSSTVSDQELRDYRSAVEPIFLKQREDGKTCYACHTVLATRLKLQALSGSAKTWTESQSRQNLEGVAKLVKPGEPSKSRLLLHPLAVSAGGDPTHGGGKFWTSKEDPEWQALAGWVTKISATSPLAKASATAPPKLSFDFYRAQVEPIFLKKRPGHARCYVCHRADAEAKRTVFRMEVIPSGATTWTEEQSRKNFERVSQYVVPGEPLTSRLLVHLLAPEAGGDSYHTGGRQFYSQKDPDWLILADWVKGHQ